MSTIFRRIGAIFVDSSPPTLANRGKTMPATRKVAKERLSVILQSQRGSELLKNIDVDAMKLDVLEVVRVSPSVFATQADVPNVFVPVS
mmetsp:Transcript_13354/g.29452  ORF Transcript_13354/g.29452 Transcript_13354/m.29452 type:complete len:89 (-) Transcript_13354:282-548(-)